MPGSPAIAAGSVALAADQNGNPLTTDQRGAGFPRVQGGSVDIGAYELPAVIGSPTVYTVNLTSANGTGSGNSGDLVYVIDQADANTNPAGSIIEFSPSVFSTPQTITLSSTLELSEPTGPLVIDGPGAGLVTITGNNSGSVFQVDSGEVATLSGLTISGGTGSYVGGGQYAGGGIFAQQFSTLTVSASTISGNTATDSFYGGGGIANGGNLSLVGCTVFGNTTTNNYFGGGGLANFFEATVTNCVFQNNTATYGGGIFNEGTLTAGGSSFTGNTAGGGGIYNSGTASLSDDTLAGNMAGSGGGGLNNTGTMSLSGSTITANTTPDGGIGGGIDNSGALTITTSTISDNTAYDGGGLINAGTMTLTTSTLSGNSGTYGAGINNESSLVVSACTVSGNGSYINGGGIYDSGGALYLVDSTVAENSAYQGGGIYDSAPGLTVINSTIAYNSDSGYGPGIYNAGGSPVLDNTIVAWNTFGGGLSPPELDTGGTPFASTSAYNLIGVDTTGSFSGNGSLVGVTNARLGPLGYNGGPTQTIALMPGSPAIDAGSVALAVDQNGNSLTTDQRGAGFPRVQGGSVDIGAYELPAVIGSPTLYTVSLTSANGTGSGNSGDLVYVIDQADANTNPAGSIVQFDPTVFGTPQTITLSSTLELSEPTGPLVVDGPGASLVTISGNNSVGVFQVDSGEVATLSGLTISGGTGSYVGGGQYAGGGIFAQQFSTLTVSASTISGNTATDSFYGGGGIANGGNLSLVGCTVFGNTTTNNYFGGGGLANFFEATVTNCVFQNNTATYGGGIFNEGTLTAGGSSFTGNTAGGGGGIYNGGTASLSGDTFAGSTGTGPGIYNNGTMSLSGSTITGNTTPNGAFGGSIDNDSGTLTITTSTITGNEAVGGGSGAGGIINFSTLTVTDSTLSDNSGLYGGGLANYGTAVLEDSTVAGNSAYQGGGLFNQGSLTVVNSTIAYNQSYGILNESGSAATLNNTLVAENSGADLNWQGGAGFTGSNNLVGYDATGSLSSSENLLNVTDPGIGLLANNGGPTQTIALLAGSPAIGVGSNALAVDPTTGQPLVYDQRGVGYPRIVAGMVDIGAYEGPDPTTTTVATSVTPSVYGQPVTFTATVAATPPLSGTAISPTGTVTFYDGTTLLGTGTLNAMRVGTYETTAFQLSVGNNQSITAVYSGDTNFNTSTSSVLSQTVIQGRQHDDRLGVFGGPVGVGSGGDVHGDRGR